ncbi:MAG: HU family DNA-binding protein [Butyricimonas faecihominis]
MTKADIVNRIAVKSGLPRKEVETIVENLMETIKTKMTEGENIYLRGFGSFVIKQRAEKTARNISKNTIMIIPAHVIPHFKPSKEFVNGMKK